MPSIEDIQDDVEDLTEKDLIVLTLLRNKTVKVTRIQKLNLFIENILDTNKKNAHGAYHYGGFSDEIDESLSSMKGDGSVSVDSNQQYSLTNYGTLVLDEALKDPDVREKVEAINTISNFFEDVTDQQLLQLTYVLYPDTTEESLIKDKISKRTKKTKFGNLLVQTNLTKDEAISSLCDDLEDSQ